MTDNIIIDAPPRLSPFFVNRKNMEALSATKNVPLVAFLVFNDVGQAELSTASITVKRSFR